MLILILGYCLNFIIYSISIYISLIIIEKLGKKSFGTWQHRIILTATCAAGVTMVQLVAQATSMIYIDLFH